MTTVTVIDTEEDVLFGDLELPEIDLGWLEDIDFTDLPNLFGFSTDLLLLVLAGIIILRFVLFGKRKK
jgi:hypothetical protein